MPLENDFFTWYFSKFTRKIVKIVITTSSDCGSIMWANINCVKNLTWNIVQHCWLVPALFQLADFYPMRSLSWPQWRSFLNQCRWSYWGGCRDHSWPKARRRRRKRSGRRRPRRSGKCSRKPQMHLRWLGHNQHLWPDKGLLIQS